MKDIINKSRDLSVYQLFEILQEEFIVCELRVKIYPIHVHKEYWKETSLKKKDKILDISKRNSLPSIFDDKRIKESFEKRVINEIGLPNFLYKDEQQRERQEKWDIHNYYMVGKEVRITTPDGSIVIGNIDKVDFDKKLVSININNKLQEFKLSEATRIL